MCCSQKLQHPALFFCQTSQLNVHQPLHATNAGPTGGRFFKSWTLENYIKLDRPTSWVIYGLAINSPIHWVTSRHPLSSICRPCRHLGDSKIAQFHDPLPREENVQWLPEGRRWTLWCWFVRCLVTTQEIDASFRDRNHGFLQRNIRSQKNTCELCCSTCTRLFFFFFPSIKSLCRIFTLWICDSARTSCRWMCIISLSAKHPLSIPEP